MVYNTHTLEICHELSEKGKEAYEKMLKEKAEDIQFKQNHFLKWLCYKLYNFLLSK
jgi:hypothetical protein